MNLHTIQNNLKETIVRDLTIVLKMPQRVYGAVPETETTDKVVEKYKPKLYFAMGKQSIWLVNK